MTLPHSTNIFDYPARFQFGEEGAPCSGRGMCTDTVIKMIVEFYEEKTYSLARIRQEAEAETSFDERPCSGINYIEVENALRRLGVTHYKVGFGADANDVWSKLDVGPVLVGVHYGSYPNKTGKCGSVTAEVGGRTDCGFTGAHAVLAIGKREHTVDGKTHRDIYTRDPDHNSPSRPEKPNFDRITISQLQTTMSNLPLKTAFGATYIIYPTQKKVLVIEPPPIVVPPPTPPPPLPPVVTKTAACGVNLRASSSVTSTVKTQINKGTKVTVAATVSGGKWSVTCPSKKTGSKWYRVSAINGKTILKLYGVKYLYGVTGLFK